VASPGHLIQIDNVQVLIPDISILNHRGQSVRLYTDLIKGKVVVLNFFYTSCINVCLMQGDRLSKIQQLLGSRLGKEVFVVSISMDPKTDTPQKLKNWAGAFGIKEGWTLVAGSNPEMNRLLKTLTGNDPGPKEMHASFMFIGNDKTGAWTTVDGLSEPDELLQILNRQMSTKR
jgi:protein SCO1